MPELSRALEVPVHELEAWRELFVRGGQEALKARPGNVVEKQLQEAERKIGQMMMELELHKKRALHLDGSRRSEK